MRIIVLNDGDTYTNAEGCIMLDIDDPNVGDDYDEPSIKDAVWHLHNHPEQSEVQVMSLDGVPLDAEVIARF